MPKIIDNLPQRLVAEARRQVKEGGYSGLTIRSVAAACGVGIGTVYNYFPSKDALLVQCMLEDWQQCVESISAVSAGADDPEPVLRCIFEQLHRYETEHVSVFRDEATAAAFAGSFSRYHQLLRVQLAEPLKKFCKEPFTAEFIAEAMLTWTIAGTDFPRIYSILQKLF